MRPKGATIAAVGFHQCNRRALRPSASQRTSLAQTSGNTSHLRDDVPSILMLQSKLGNDNDVYHLCKVVREKGTRHHFIEPRNHDVASLDSGIVGGAPNSG